MATPGSPISRIWMSPLRYVSSAVFLLTPPNSWSARDLLISLSLSFANIDGAIDFCIRVNNSPDAAISSICSLSSSFILISVKGTLSCLELIIWYTISNIGVFLFLFISDLTTGITFAVILWPGRCLLTRSPSSSTLAREGCAPLGTFSGSS